MPRREETVQLLSGHHPGLYIIIHIQEDILWNSIVVSSLIMKEMGLIFNLTAALYSVFILSLFVHHVRLCGQTTYFLDTC